MRRPTVSSVILPTDRDPRFTTVRRGDLVLDDQRLRNHLCWSVFEC
jgi:hypothetical protein